MRIIFKKSLFLIALLLFSLYSLLAISDYYVLEAKASVYETSSKVLFVWRFTGDEMAWTGVGQSPYLDNDTNNYITNKNVGNASWFLFQNTSSSAIQQVFLSVEWKCDERRGNEVTLFLHDGTSETSLGGFNVSVGKYSWQTINVTSILGTVAQINAAKMKVRSNYDAFAVSVSVRRTYLQIFYGGYPDKILPHYGIAGKNVTIAVQWKAPDGMSSYAFNHNNSGTWLSQNLTGSLSGTTAWSNVTLTLQGDSTKTVAFCFWANDTQNNWETTGIRYVLTAWNHFNPSDVKNVTQGTYQSLIAPNGRKAFFRAGRFWIFYVNSAENPHGFYYISSTDGLTWTQETYVDQTAEGYGVYVSDESHDDMDYVHVLFSNLTKTPPAPLKYRRGQLFSNGTIQWSTSAQIVHNVGSGERDINFGSVVDSNAYPYVTFEYQNDQNTCEEYVSKSQFNNGTWATASGYPKLFYNQTKQGYEISSWIFRLPHDNMYIIFGETDQTLRGRFLNTTSNTFGPIQNISSNRMAHFQYWSGVSDSKGNIHVTYRTTTSFYYCFREASTGMWTIRDQFLTNYITLGTGYAASSYGALTYDKERNRSYFNWWTDDQHAPCAWTMIRYADGTWSPRKRSIVLDKNFIIHGESTTAPPYSFDSLLYGFSATDSQTGKSYLFAYNYRFGNPLWNPADITNDLKIDIDDIVEAAVAYCSYPEHPRWNPHADINQDNVIDIDDIIVIAVNFGKAYP